jgi:hypothetical protein
VATLTYGRGRWMNIERPGGAVFFVGGGTVALNGVGASDAYKGTTPEEPLSTIQAGLDKCVAGRGDTVVVLPGNVTITAALTMTIADVTLTGSSVTGPKTRNPSLITCATDSVEMIAIDAANCVVENLTLDHNTTTAAVYLIDVGDTTAAPGTILRNLFIDMEGSATDTDAIRLGDGTQACDYCKIDGCVVHDCDQIAITVADLSEACVIENCLVYDSVSANIMSDALSIAADNTIIQNCALRSNSITSTNGVIVFTATAQDCFVTDCHVWSNGADSNGILYADAATATVSNLHVTSDATGTCVEHTSDVDGLSGATGEQSLGQGAVSALINPSIGGTP